jgi:hypothetical protein
MNYKAPRFCVGVDVVSALVLLMLIAWSETALAQISLPFKLPQGANNPLASLAGLEQKAAEAALAKVLDNELPLRLDAASVFPTVSVLPGGPFRPTPLQLAPEDLERPLPPGDYTMQTLAFCTEYSVHRPGMGTAYELAPLQGKAADAIYALLWRGTIEKHLPPQQLQVVSWTIQSGLTYNQMPKPYQAVIDAVIPDYKGQLEGNFLQQLQDTYQSVAKAAQLPPLEKVLGGMGQSGQLALSAMRQQQILLRQNTTDQLRDQTLFRGQESGVYTPVKAEEGPWTERIPHVAYVRYKIIGGNYATNNVMEIRILPDPAMHNARNLPPGFLRVMYGGQLAQAAGVLQRSVHALFGGTTGEPVGKGAQVLIPIPVTAPGACPPAPPKPYQKPADLPKDACWCQKPNFTPPVSACDSHATAQQRTWTPNANWSGKSLHLPTVDVYTDYCYGQKVDGIMFLPKAAGSCSAQDVHIRQFVMTTCPAGVGKCGKSYDSSCGMKRDLDYWYLDECNAASGHLTPDLMTGDVHVISDQPSTWIPATGQPVQKTFYDFLMCGNEVTDAFTWTRTGNSTSANSCNVPQSPTYSDPLRVNIDPTMGGSGQNVADVVCNIHNAQQFVNDQGVNDQGLNAIQSYAGCGHAP